MTFHLHLLTYVYYSTHIYTLLSTSYPPLNPLPSLLFSLSPSLLPLPSSPSPPPPPPSSPPLISLKPSLPLPPPGDQISVDGHVYTVAPYRYLNSSFVPVMERIVASVSSTADVMQV